MKTLLIEEKTKLTAALHTAFKMQSEAIEKNSKRVQLLSIVLSILSLVAKKCFDEFRALRVIKCFLNKPVDTLARLYRIIISYRTYSLNTSWNLRMNQRITGEETDTVNGGRVKKSRILQNYRVVWVDGNINNSNNECRNKLEKLQGVFNDVQLFNNANACVDCLQDILEEKVFVILSDSLVEEMVPIIHSLVQVATICILCDHRVQDQTWNKDWWKVKDVYTDIDSICDALKQSARQCNQDFTPMSFAPLSASPIIDLDQLEPSFMYTQLFKGIFLEMKHEEQAREDLVQYYRHEKAAFPNELRRIDEFQRDYHPDKAIWWYTREGFTYQMLNRALRLLESDIIIKMGFFIHDLHRQIEKLHREQLDQYGGEVFTVYRGQGLFDANFRKLESTQGGLLSFNSFVSTSKNRDLALLLAESSSLSNDKIGIVFVMTINPVLISTPFACIAELSDFGETEAEVLFSMHSVFRVDRVQGLDEEGRLFEVGLTLTADDDPQLRILKETIDKEVKGPTSWDSIGNLLIKVGDTKKAEQLYSMLLEQTSTDGARALYNHQMGYIRSDQGDYHGALAYYERALEIRQTMAPPNHLFCAVSHSSIAAVYLKMGEYSKALLSNEKALEIQQKILPLDHPDFAQPYNNIGAVYDTMGEYPKALWYYEKYLDLRQQVVPANHPDLAVSNTNIGSMHLKMGEYTKALSYYKNALLVREKSLPIDHPDFAQSYNNMGSVYRKMGEYTKALLYFEKTLEINQKTLPANHPSLATSYNNIGLLYHSMREYTKALSSHEKALEIRQKTLSAAHPSLATSYNNIGNDFMAMADYSKASSHYEKALDIWQKTLPIDHPDLATCHSNLGTVYYHTGEYAKALSSQEIALDIYRKTFPVNHPCAATSYSNIGFIYQSMGDYPRALLSHERALEIREKTLPTDHPDLAASYSSVGSLHTKMGEHSKAALYLEKSLAIDQKTLSVDQPDLANQLIVIGGTLCLAGEHSKALLCFQSALDIRQRSLPPTHPNIQKTLDLIDVVKRKL